MSTAPAQLTVGDAARIGRAVAFADRLDRGGLNQTPQPHGGERPQPPPAWVVRVTGAVMSSGLYPAVVREFDMGSGSAAWQDAAGEEPCYAYHVTGAELASGDIAVGLLVGEDLEDGRSVFAVGSAARPPLTTQNVGGTQVNDSTFDLRFSEASGSQVTNDGLYSTHRVLAASLTQQGAVSRATEQFLEGTKTVRGQRPLVGTLGPYLAVGASSILRSDGRVPNYAGLGAPGVGGLTALTNWSDPTFPTVIGMAVSVGSISGNYATAWLHPRLEDVDGVERMCWVVGDPYTVFSGYDNIPPGFAVSNAVGGTHVGIDRNFASGELPVVRGGIVVGWTSPSSPPAPAVPPPPVIPPPTPLPPPPPPTLPETTISGTVSRSAEDGGGPLAGRTVNLLGVGTTTTTNASGGYSFTTLGGGSRFVQVAIGSGETATHSVDGTPGVGNTASVILTASTHDVDFTIDGAPAATVNVTVQNAVGSTPLSGRTVTIGSTSQTTNGSGQASFAGVTPGSTNVVLTLGGSDTASWAVDTPGASGKGNTATFTSTNGGTHGVTFQVSVAPSPGPGGGE